MIDTASYSPLKFCDFIERDAFHQKVDPSVFHPIGIRVTEPDPIDVYYIPCGKTELDAQWQSTRFPQSVSHLAAVIKEAFEQYCGEDWCGGDARDEVLEELEDEDMHGSGAKDLFVKDAYVPFYEIQSIYLCPDADTVVIGGRTDIDFNLDEHGADIRISPSGTKFGYGADFDELYAVDD